MQTDAASTRRSSKTRERIRQNALKWQGFDDGSDRIHPLWSIVMNEEDEKLTLEFRLGNINEADFRRLYSVKFSSWQEHAHDLVLEAKRHQDWGTLEWAMSVGDRFGLLAKTVMLLCQVVEEPWHYQHENIILFLDDLRDPKLTDSFFKVSQMQFDYLDYNESGALGSKCVYALYHIGTPEAIQKIRELKKTETREMVVGAIDDNLGYVKD